MNESLVQYKAPWRQEPLRQYKVTLMRHTKTGVLRVEMKHWKTGKKIQVEGYDDNRLWENLWQQAQEK